MADSQSLAAGGLAAAGAVVYCCVQKARRDAEQHERDVATSKQAAGPQPGAPAAAPAAPGPFSFVLVGGAMHAAKHWDPLVAVLSAGGHNVAAVELPGLGESKEDPLRQTLESHVAAIVAAVDKAPRPPVIVAHSLAGVTVAGAAERLRAKVRRIVFVAAETRPGAGFAAIDPPPEWLPEGLLAFEEGGKLMTVAEGKLERICEIFFNGADKEAAAAAGALLRPQPTYDEAGLVLTDEGYGAVPKAYVKTLRDRCLPSHAQDMFAERIGDAAPRFELDCGHAPFLVCPDKLAETLLVAAAA